ncbi:MAG: adenine-specific methyltransferase EcoRI family protein [Candidatus Saccharibacteria bacterium]|nr:adenine-specific methyltransferase EcoRI family protein [Candidatus Saccharibacteria bacterium]
MGSNANLHKANKAKKDEFYTQLPDIENELKHYKEHFKGKTVFCNCDDPYESNFFKYFAMNFNHLGLKKLICTSYSGSPIVGQEFSDLPLFKSLNSKKAYKVEITEVYDENKDGAVDMYDIELLIKNMKNKMTLLKGDGDFRSKEAIECLREADIVVTNPPFSLFREYLAQLIEYKKLFLIIGNMNAITYKEVFPLIKDNKIWLGYGFKGGNAFFSIPVYSNEYAKGVYNEETGLVKFRNCTWYTNIDHNKRHEELILYKKYSPEEYPKYDNYDAINVDKVNEIPDDYNGVMGVPITFLDKYNPDQFEIVAFRKGEDGRDLVFTREREDSTILSYPCTTSIPGMIKNAEGKINGKITYARITIMKKSR